MELIIAYGRSPGSTPILTPISSEPQRRATLKEAVKRIDTECQNIRRNSKFFHTKNRLNFCKDWKERITTLKAIQKDLEDVQTAITSLKTALVRKKAELNFFNFLPSLTKWVFYTIYIHTLEKAEKNLAIHEKVNLPEDQKCETIIQYLHLLRALGYEHNQALAEFMLENQKKALTLSNQLRLLKQEKGAFNQLLIKFIKNTYPETYQIAFRLYGIKEKTLISPYQLRMVLSLLKTAHKLSETEIDTLLTKKGFKAYLSPPEFADLRAKFLRETFCLASPGLSMETEQDQTLFQDVCEELTGKEYAETGSSSRGMHYHSSPIRTLERALQLLENLGYTNEESTQEFAEFLKEANLRITCYAHLSSKEEIRAFNQIVVSYLQTRAPLSSFYAIEALLEESETVIPEEALDASFNSEIPEPLFTGRFEALLQNYHLRDLLSREDEEALKLEAKKFVVQIKRDGTFTTPQNEAQFMGIFLQFLITTFPDKEPEIQRIIHLKSLTGSIPSPVELWKRCKNRTPLSDPSLRALLSTFGFTPSFPFYEEFKEFIRSSSFRVKNLTNISSQERNEFSYLCYSFLINAYPQREEKLAHSRSQFFQRQRAGGKTVTATSLSKAYNALAPIHTSMEAWLNREQIASY